MSKLSDLKAKLSEKLALVRGKFGKGAESNPDNPYAQPSAFQKTKLAWKGGGPGTRILLIVLLLTITVGIYSLGRLAQRLFERRAQLQASLHKGTEKYDKMEDFLKRQAEMKFEAASITSLYRIRMNTTLDNGKAAFVEISLYVRCDSPRTAKVVEEIYPKLHDAILTKVQLVQESDVTTEAGKERLKAIMIEAMNSVMPAPGKILDVFFTNLIFE